MVHSIPKQIVFGVLLIALFFIYEPILGDSAFLINETSGVKEKKPTSLFFVGDIMLGRVVENAIERNGFSYVFGEIEEVIAESDFTVGNFEGVVNKNHIKTQPYGFAFSIKEEYLKKLGVIGFDSLSLANNHSFDFGAGSFSYTQEKCEQYNILCLGHPKEITQYSVGIQEIGGYSVGFLFIHTLFEEQDENVIENVLTYLRDESDFVAVYVHWGDEYKLLHGSREELLAHRLIDLGADTVIGHHPHVVQDIETYKGKPIFYSLGNFVFDQYFNDDVKEGLGVKILLTETGPQYQIVGFLSPETSLRPRVMNEKESYALFSRITHRYQFSDKEGYANLNF